MDRIRKGGDLYAHRSKFFDAFNRYIVNPLKTNASGIACKTDFKISVTGHVESQEKIKRIDPRNNAAAPFLWLIDRINRRKHPVRYWTRRLWPVFLLALLAAIGCVTWMWQHNRVEGINKEGERIFNKAQTEFKETQVTHSGYSKHERFLGTSVTNLHTLFTPFPDVREKSNVAYTNLLTKYLIVAADAAYLKKKDDIKNSKQKPESDQAYALRRSACEIETPSAFIEYKAVGRSNEVELAEKRLREHHEKKVPEVVSEYNEKYFDARFDMLETNAAQVASQKYIYGLTNELAVWKQECSIIPTWSNHIEHIISRIVARCPAWRAAFASNIVQNVRSFEYEVKARPDEIFLFEKKKIGPKLHKLLAEEEPAEQLNLDSAKKGLLKACRKSYFEQKRFKTSAEQYPEDSKLRDNLNRLLQDTTLTNCVSEWMSDLHEKQRLWLHVEIGHVHDTVLSKATDYSKFLVRPPREGMGDRVHSLLSNCREWADEETDDKKKTVFDKDCAKVWEQFRSRYFTEKKWKFDGNYNYPIAEDNLEDKIRSLLENTRLDVKDATSKWLSKMREMQKQWLMDAMEDCQKFPDGFDAFKDDGSGEDIKKVLSAAESFIKESLSEDEELNRINTVKEKRKDFLEAMKEKYFKDKRFAPSYEFSLKDGARWSDEYQSAKEEVQKGLELIFVPETGCGINKVTNEWMRILWQHERDWLNESKNTCTNKAAKFLASEGSNAIVDFVTRHSGNPFLWRYVVDVKKNSKDFDVNKFKEDISRYADNHDSNTLTELKERYESLSKDAKVLAKAASAMKGQYAGLYEVFALRHLWANSIPVRTSERKSSGDRIDIKALSQEVQRVADEISDERWLSSEYKIKRVSVTLTHPDGVVTYRPVSGTKWDRNEDAFFFSVNKGSVGGQNFLSSAKTFNHGRGHQASDSITEDIELDKQIQLDLFSSLEFSGYYREKYQRDSAEKGKPSDDPQPVGSEKSPLPWALTVYVPHLRSGNVPLVMSPMFTYDSRAGKWTNSKPTTQRAELTVSVDGEVIGPTPYDRIEACIKKAQEMESDMSNGWKKRCRAAEDRLEELNKILSDGDESDVGGQP